MKKLFPYMAGVLLFVALLLLLLNKGPRTFDGRITLNHRDKIPYGTYTAYNLLQQQFPNASVEINKLAPAEWKTLSYDTSRQVLFIVNSYFNPSESELDNLTAFAQKGNYVFISALQMNETAQKFFKVKQENYYDNSLYNKTQEGGIKALDSFSVHLDTSLFDYPWNYSYPGISYDNYFIRSDSSFTYHLGYANNNKPNLIAINAGDGTMFIHAAPITFSNFFLLYNNNHQYFEKLLSVIPQSTEKIVWDEYFLYKRNASSDDNKGLLHVIFQYENFRWAFWTAMVLLALYTITEVKRKQRIIPAYQKPVNDSLEFVTTIGKLYYEKGDHKNLAEKLTQFFLDHLRSKYNIKTNDLNNEFAKNVSAKTNVSLEEVTEIINYIHFIQYSENIRGEQLMQYYQLLENFYKKA